MSEPPSPIGRPPAKVISLMAAACAMAVATIYYNQPLLPLMAKSFGHPVGDIGRIATATQLGYAVGLFLFVPLDDRMDRRSVENRSAGNIGAQHGGRWNRYRRRPRFLLRSRLSSV
jgi:MFS family permease